MDTDEEREAGFSKNISYGRFYERIALYPSK